MAEILFAPDRERIASTNAWAFMHWMRATQVTDVTSWAALQQYSANRPDAFSAALAAFAGARISAEMSAGDLAGLLLHADLRPDDRVVAAGIAWPWPAWRYATAVRLETAPDPITAAAEERASVLVAPAGALAEATFRRSHRSELGTLRSIVAVGGPLSAQARRRIYTWGKADVLLLARTADTFWGNPLEPVLAGPAATPAFFMSPTSDPAPRCR